MTVLWPMRPSSSWAFSFSSSWLQGSVRLAVSVYTNGMYLLRFQLQLHRPLCRLPSRHARYHSQPRERLARLLW